MSDSRKCHNCSRVLGNEHYCPRCGTRATIWALQTRVYVPVILSCMMSGAIGYGVSSLISRRAIEPLQATNVRLDLEFRTFSDEAAAARRAERAARESLTSQVRALQSQVGAGGTTPVAMQAELARVVNDLGVLKRDAARLEETLRAQSASVDQLGLKTQLHAETLAQVTDEQLKLTARVGEIASNNGAQALADVRNRLATIETWAGQLEAWLRQSREADRGQAAREYALQVAQGGKDNPANWLILTDALARNQRVTQEQVRRILGTPDSVQSYTYFVVWNYKVSGRTQFVTITNGVLTDVTK